MKKAVFSFGLVLSLAVIGLSQARTITNSTLQKFQQQRLNAERDYRENYERLGFPSPEELDRQREEDMASRLQLADQLRQARLEKERLELEHRSIDLQAVAIDNEIAERQYNGFYGGFVGGFGGFGGFSDGRFGRRHGRFPFGFDSGGYRATPVGVYPNPNPGTFRFFSRGRARSGGFIRTGRR